jgi:thiol-disulfide isomerase/thioredoxin
VVESFAGKVRFVTENYGASALARRFGVTRYPAIFVDDVLVATPKDFGFYGKGEGGQGGRYAPFVRNAENQQRFRDDLARILTLVLSGRKGEARAQAVSADAAPVASFPTVPLVDLDGRSLARADLAGRPVLVEFWATWCPPCRSTLAWLGELKQRYGDTLTVITVAVDSDAADVRKLSASLGLPFHWVMGSETIGRAFGDVSAVPTLLLFDAQGASAGAFFGATPTLHTDVESRLRPLVEKLAAARSAATRAGVGKS